ncbi:MAG: hypothetical protein M1833_004795 [Piccolia ochrophora]|nr:MAG: hypothetical protein M1833_004795 [Piccolia ochrophora]
MPSLKLHSRHFKLDRFPPLPVNPQAQLLASLEQVITLVTKKSQPPPPHSGLYSGPIGIAYLLHLVHQHHPSLTVHSRPLSHWISVLLAHPPGPPHPTRQGIASSPTTHLTISAIVNNSLTTARSALSALSAAAEPNPDVPNEWLYGRAGSLYLLRLLRHHFPPLTPSINETITVIANIILHAPRPWTWHGKHYLGAAHGDVGIITQLILSVPSLAQRLEPDLNAVLDAQLPSGNWPSSVAVPSSSSSSQSDKLVQFCHGASGIIPSLRSILPHASATITPRITAAIQRGEACVLERGLLRKQPGLCHGITGNALALRDAAFKQFLTLTTEDWVREGLRQELWSEMGQREGLSLMEGAAGRAWGWLVISGGRERRMVGYNDV